MSQDANGIYQHTTIQEKKFLDRIGKFSELRQISVRDKLTGYLKGSDKRTDWYKIDKLEVIRYAGELLNKALPI